MRIAHLSDLHILALSGVPMRRLLTNKRITGYANIMAGRGHAHRLEVVQALARELASANIDHVVVTGDLSNLSLDGEFAAARDLLEHDLGLSANAVSVVPGNHDRYTRGSFLARRFERHLEPYLHSDLTVPSSLSTNHFPVIKLRGPVAIIGLSTAVPRLPFVAAGQVGLTQLQALSWALEQPEVKARTLVLLIHHPLVHAKTRINFYLEGLRDAEALRDRLQDCARGLVLHGHLHRRMLRIVPTRAGELWSVGATSASLVHPGENRMAGYNLYEVSDDGAIQRVSARVLDMNSWTFDTAPVPVLGVGESG